jgi:hypothetical protein
MRRTLTGIALVIVLPLSGPRVDAQSDACAALRKSAARREPRVSKGEWITIGAISGGVAALIAYCGMGYCEQ